MNRNEPIAHRYRVVHPDRVADGLYAVLDTEQKRYVAASSVKSFVISEAQRLNGFMPVDGGEQTYAQQMVRRRNSH